MTLFKKKETKNDKVPSQVKENITENSPTIKRKKRIGFGKKIKKDLEHQPVHAPSLTLNTEQVSNQNQPSSLYDTSNGHQENIDLFLEEITAKDEIKKDQLLSAETPEEHEWTAGRLKTFTQKDMKGKQVFLEDTGERIGSVFDDIYDANKKLIGYKIKDNKSEAILSFPLEQFDEDKNGLIFIPSWYSKGMKTIEKLEFKDKITPELMWLIKDNTVSTEELYSIFVKHDDKITNYIEEAVALRELLNNRLKVLEKERLTLKETLMDLTEKRLINDLDRRKFSEIVMDHRRKVNVVDINIKKCKELLDRLHNTSFGLLSRSITLSIEKEEHGVQTKTIEKKEHMQTHANIDEPYKEKYFEMKHRYEILHEEHNELKNAVEKLISKNELS
jgi:hypothetical protein